MFCATKSVVAAEASTYTTPITFSFVFFLAHTLNKNLREFNFQNKTTAIGEFCTHRQ